MALALEYPHIEKPADQPARLQRLPRVRVAQIAMDYLAHGWSADEIRRLQQKLIAEGVLEPGMDAVADTFPLDDEVIDRAIAEAGHDFTNLARAFTLPTAELIARVRNAYAATDDPEARVRYAHILGILGDATGADDLGRAVVETPWDEGWNYKGMGQFGRSMSELDSRIIALGRCGGGETVVTTLIAKAETLPEDAEFSHYRALSEAFAALGDERAVPVLETLLERPALTGHAQTGLGDRIGGVTDERQENRVRNRALIELHLARALVQLAPEHPQATVILERYARDQRATFARHAKAILDDRAKHLRRAENRHR